MCICVSVCPAIRFHISHRIFSKFGGNILWVMTRIVACLIFSARNAHTTHARACVLNARMCAFAYISTDSLQICWEHITTHHKCQGLRSFHVYTPPHARVRARAWLSIQLSLDGFSSNLMDTYNKWPQVTWDTYLSCSSITCTRVSARVIKHSLIFERILSKFGDIQHIPRGYMRHLICVLVYVLTAHTSIHSQIFQARDGQWLVQFKYSYIQMWT
jgi:hypothetical protein